MVNIIPQVNHKVNQIFHSFNQVRVDMKKLEENVFKGYFFKKEAGQLANLAIRILFSKYHKDGMKCELQFGVLQW
jgi:hypothetical protein